jgi:DnaJ-class molecular chaperone
VTAEILIHSEWCRACSGRGLARCVRTIGNFVDVVLTACPHCSGCGLVIVHDNGMVFSPSRGWVERTQ